MFYVPQLFLEVEGPTSVRLTWGVETTTPAKVRQGLDWVTVIQIDRYIGDHVWGPLAVFSPTTEYIDTTCTPKTSYRYRIRIRGYLTGWGVYSPVAYIKTSELPSETTLTETVVPTENFAAVVDPHDIHVKGLVLLDVVTPTDNYGAVFVPWDNTVEWNDVVTPIENFLIWKWNIIPLNLTDTVSPTENLGSVAGVTKGLTDIVVPIETVVLVFTPPEVEIGPDLLLVLFPKALNTPALHKFAEGKPWGYWDTKDIDFGFPGIEKTGSKLVFWGTPSTPIVVTVRMSCDGGNSWPWSEAITFDKAHLGVVHPWLTGESFRIRFEAYGLSLSGFHFIAVPRGQDGPPQ